MQPNLSGNANRFIIFTVFFNARAYYPVLAILFIDLGLSLDQFVLLNLIWAATIFIFEVPSGALADTIGRRKLLMAASALMFIEMLCLLLAPRDGGALLFALCIINRICSGLSEACASGADEALAYDSLPEHNRTATWDRLLASAMRWRSAGFIVAMIIGGLLYDARVINAALPHEWHLPADVVHRLPVALVLLQAVVCLLFSFKMIEPIQPNANPRLKQVARLTLNTARWVLTHPRILVAILIGVAIDSILRNFATINSSYYRLIDLPEWTYGFIGAAMGVLGLFVPGIAKYLNQRFNMLVNLGIVAIASLIGLLLLIPAWPIYGVIPVMFLMTMISLLSFTISRVLHQEADSSRRATVLSVKGLVFNLGYGIFSLGFSCLLAGFPDQDANNALHNALIWQTPYFAILVIILLLWSAFYLRRNTQKINTNQS